MTELNSESVLLYSQCVICRYPVNLPCFEHIRTRIAGRKMVMSKDAHSEVMGLDHKESHQHIEVLTLHK